MSPKTWPTTTSEHIMSDDLSPNRAAALRKWLNVANARLLTLQRQRQQLIANATALARQLEQLQTSRAKWGRLLAPTAKTG